MTSLQHVFDGTEENFQQLVIENSSKGVILVNYWTPKAGPCFKLWQVLEKLSQEYQGRFLLVNINTDTQNALVRSNGINSVPTIKVYKDGEVIDAIYGAESEISVRGMIDRYVSSIKDIAAKEALRVYQSGKPEEALQILARAATGNPHSVELRKLALKILLREKRYADIQQYFSVLSEGLQSHTDIATVTLHAKLLLMAGNAPSNTELDAHLKENPGDLDSAMTRAATALADDDFEHALEYFFYIMRSNCELQDGIAHKAILLVFTLLGNDHELTREFQTRLRDLLQ
jgi:putative thioredoxin